MPIPLFVIGAKCKYMFSALNLPPELKIESNLITGKVSTPGEWIVTLTAFPSNLKYPVLQTTFTVVVTEKITRTVSQDVVFYQGIEGVIRSLTYVEDLDLTPINGTIKINHEAAIIVQVPLVRVSGTVDLQLVTDVIGTIRVADNWNTVPSSSPIISTIAKSSSFGNAINSLKLYETNTLSASSGTVLASSQSLISTQVQNQSFAITSTNLKEIISSNTRNRSDAVFRAMGEITQSKVLNQSTANLFPLQLIETKTRNGSTVNLNR
jgi:hypothetical protein